MNGKDFVGVAGIYVSPMWIGIYILLVVGLSVLIGPFDAFTTLNTVVALAAYATVPLHFYLRSQGRVGFYSKGGNVFCWTVCAVSFTKLPEVAMAEMSSQPPPTPGP